MDQENNNSDIFATVHQSLTRPHLLNGCNRELFLLLSIVSAVVIGPLGFLAVRPSVGFAGVGLFLFGRLVLGQLAKYDPQAKAVYQRALSYHDFYPANAPISEDSQ